MKESSLDSLTFLFNSKARKMFPISAGRLEGKNALLPHQGLPVHNDGPWEPRKSQALRVQTARWKRLLPSGPSTFLILNPRHVALVVLRQEVELTDPSGDAPHLL